jgi:microcystin-dependent protein
MQVFLGSMVLVPYNFAPKGYALCQGQLMAISQNTALFSLLGTQFGGNGTSTFGLPNLQGSVPVGKGQGPGLSDYSMGEITGTPNVTLLTSEVPPHNHAMNSEKTGGQASPVNNAIGTLVGQTVFSDQTAPLTPLNAGVLPAAGNSQPHNNMMPYQGLNWVIALEGIFPPRS